MNEPDLLFSDCTRTQLAVYAKKVLAGSWTISVWVHGRCPNLFAVGFPPHVVLQARDWSDEPMREWKKFESGMYLKRSPFLNAGWADYYASPERPANTSAKQLYLPEILDWLTSEGCALSRGLWKTSDPELMAAGLRTSFERPPHEHQHYKIEFDGKPQRIICFTEIEAIDGRKFYEDFDRLSLDYAFHQKQSCPEPETVKRTGNDASAPVAAHIKGGEVRKAQYKKLRKEAVRLYKDGTFQSKRHASKKLIAPLRVYAIEHGLPRIISWGAIYRYLLEDA
jgi:hypothetical protein